jgi:hypothetical protein
MLKASSEFNNTVRVSDPTVRLREIWFMLSVDERFSFIESNIKIENSKGSTIPLVLTEFQRKWFHTGPLFSDFTEINVFNNRICLKCRNIGASYLLIALEAVLTCWIYGKVFIPFISATEPQSKDLIVYCKKVIENCSFKIPLDGSLKDQSSMLIKFANGSKIRAFQAGNPAGLRGPRALCVYCFPGDQEILTDVGSVKIRDVVEKGIGKYVLSMDKDNNISWKRILNRVKNPSRGVVTVSGDFGNFRCTSDHPIMTESHSKVMAKSSLNENIYILNTNSCDVNEKTFKSTSKNEFSGDPIIIRDDNGRRGDISGHNKTSKLLSSFHLSSGQKILYGLETSCISSLGVDSSSGNIGIYRKKEYTSDVYPETSGIHPLLPTSYEQEKSFTKMDSREDVSSGMGSVLHGGRFQVEEGSSDVIYPRFYQGVGDSNIRIFEYKLGDFECDSIGQTGEGGLYNPSFIRSSEIFRDDKSSHASRFSLQDFTQYVHNMQEEVLSREWNPDMFREMSFETREEKEYGITENKDSEIQMSNMWKNVSSYPSKKRFIKTSSSKNMQYEMCKGMEEDSQERLPEEEVYNIEVEDNHNVFLKTSKDKYACVWQCDEFAFAPNPQEILSAAEYFIAQGGQLNILSTPWGKNNVYWKIWTDRINYKDWIRVCVSLFTDMRGFDVEISLKRQILEHGFILSCPWLNIDFLEKKRQQDAPNGYMNFLQEMCAVPFEEASGAISSGVLDANQMDSYYCEGRINKEQVFVMGADFGADRNVTAVCVFECKDGRFIVCYTTTIRGPFPSQKRAMLELVKRFRPNVFVGDSTGMGGKAWMDTLEEEIDDKMVIVPLNYSKKDLALADGNLDLNNKNYMVETVVRLMSEGLIITPKNHRDLREELLGMQKIVYEKTIKYSGKDGLVGRDDLAFAFLEGGFMYSRIFSLGDDDHIGVVDSGMKLSHSYKPDTRRPKISSGSFEGGSASLGVNNSNRSVFNNKYNHLI